MNTLLGDITVMGFLDGVWYHKLSMPSDKTIRENYNIMFHRLNPEKLDQFDTSQTLPFDSTFFSDFLELLKEKKTW